tara:strand:+ start:53 stop:598 length:546 start_codon:yes stop_codon:yes gene_type:complete
VNFRDADLYKTLHEQDPSYGATSIGYLLEVEKIIKQRKFGAFDELNSVIDFGCGKGTLLKALNDSNLSVNVDGYDPAIPEYKDLPDKKYDMLICTDVLEHVYEDELRGVYNQFDILDPSVMYLVVCTREAYSILPDGTNAHKTIKDICWWIKELKNYFDNYSVELLRYNGERQFGVIIMNK